MENILHCVQHISVQLWRDKRKNQQALVEA